MNKTGKWYAYYVSKDSLDWSDSQLKLRLKITGGPNAAPTDAFTNATPGNHRRNLLTRGIVYTRLRIRLDRGHAGQCAVDREMLHPLVETGRRNSHDERAAVPDRCRFEVGSEKWVCRWTDSNRRPTHYECVALPPELHRQRSGAGGTLSFFLAIMPIGFNTMNRAST